jgi:NADH-quinone oxidoreductase subunit F
VDIRLHDARPTDEERAAVETVLGPPSSAWTGTPRTAGPEMNTEAGGRARRERRHLLLPALQALQARVGWVSDGGIRLVCEQLGIPPAEAWSVATFYALLATSPRPRRVVHVCDDIRCRAHGAAELCRQLAHECGPELAHRHGAPAAQPAACWMRSPCLGLCDHGPAALLTDAGDPAVERLLGPVTAESVKALLAGGTADPDAAARFALPQRGEAGLVLLRRVGVVDPSSLEAYVASGGYQALPRALAIGPEAVIAEVEAAKLVGRGGAAFPAARKWATVRAQAATPRYLVCNADESEPGTFKDRVLLTGDPFAVVESMTIAAFAAGCAKGWLYVRAEYPLAHERMAAAVAAARQAGWLGERVGGTSFAFDIELRRGAGAYVCGEETALFESIEGLRGEPGTKPPFPVEQGLFRKPTVVNNVETLVNVLPIVMEGGAAYASRGTPGSTGTRLFCVSGSVRQSGVYEVPMGTSLRALIERAGGVAPGRSIAAVLMGGAAGTFIRPDEIDLPLTLEDARAAGTTLGSGVVMVFDDAVDLRDVVRRIAAFFRDESCGQCVPCRVGTVRQEEALHRLEYGRPRSSVQDELSLLAEVGAGMRDASICGLGQAASSAVESAIHRLKLFGEPPPPAAPVTPPARVDVPGAAPGHVAVRIDGRRVEVPAGTTLLAACRRSDIEVPTLCFLETLVPANACRLCVVEVEGARVLVPSCSRAAEPGMVVHTRSERVRAARRMALEMLASSVDLSAAPEVQELCAEYGVRAERYGPPSPPADRDRATAGHHARPAAGAAASVAQPVKVDNELYVRDYAKCVLCYRCVQACGAEHQNTFAIGVAGRGFDARISTEANLPLGESACVYCGNCVAVCPTGALMAKTEFDLRAAGEWAPSRQTVTETICPYCGVGCTLSLYVQDGRIVKVASPFDNAITLGNLCVKGRFGWTFVQPEGPKRA